MFNSDNIGIDKSMEHHDYMCFAEWSVYCYNQLWGEIVLINNDEDTHALGHEKCHSREYNLGNPSVHICIRHLKNVHKSTIFVIENTGNPEFFPSYSGKIVIEPLGGSCSTTQNITQHGDGGL